MVATGFTDPRYRRGLVRRRLHGVYTVTDTGRRIAGREIDIYVPAVAEAKKFGEKMVRVRVLDEGSRMRDARQKDIPAATAKR